MNLDGLPPDLHLRIYDTVLELRQPRRVLPPDLKREIETRPIFTQVLRAFENRFGREYALLCAESTLIHMFINTEYGSTFGVHEDLRREFPHLNEAQLLDRLMHDDTAVERWMRTPSALRYAQFLEN